MHAALLTLSLLATSAQHSTPPSPARAEPPHSTALTTGGLVWSRTVDDPAPQVALGDRGGQVLAWEPDRALVLISSFDSNPPAPIWTATLENGLRPIIRAADADVYLHCDVRYRAYSAAAVLKKFVAR